MTDEELFERGHRAFPLFVAALEFWAWHAPDIMDRSFPLWSSKQRADQFVEEHSPGVEIVQLDCQDDLDRWVATASKFRFLSAIFNPTGPEMQPGYLRASLDALLTPPGAML